MPSEPVSREELRDALAKLAADLMARQQQFEERVGTYTWTARKDYVTRDEFRASLKDLADNLTTRQQKLEERIGNYMADMKGHVSGFVTELRELAREAGKQRLEILESNRMMLAQIDRNGNHLDRALEGISLRLSAFEKASDKPEKKP